MTVNEAIEHLQALARITGGNIEVHVCGRVEEAVGDTVWIKPLGFWETSTPTPENDTTCPRCGDEVEGDASGCRDWDCPMRGGS